MPRPQKLKLSTPDRRAIDEPGEEPLAHIARQAAIDELRTDPFHEAPLACLLAPVLLNRATPSDRELVGNLFVQVLETATPEQAENFFAQVATLKRNASQPHRNARAYFGYCSFIEATGREPSKPELKAYLDARPDEFPGLPPGYCLKSWNRLFKDSGLEHLAKK